MNIPYLTQHISRHLHTIVRSVCLSTGAVFASFCARKDFSDPCLTPEILAACLKQTGDLPLLFSLNQQAVYAIVPLAEAGCPRQFCSVKEKPSNLGRRSALFLRKKRPCNRPGTFPVQSLSACSGSRSSFPAGFSGCRTGLRFFGFFHGYTPGLQSFSLLTGCAR